MSQSSTQRRNIINGDASGFAFRLGQSVQRVLMDRAIVAANSVCEEDGQTTVTLDHVLRALDQSVLAEACRRLGVVIDAGTRPRRSLGAA
jgi:hypothetical protein